AEPAVAELVRRLEQAPFAAPEADELVACGLGPRELAAAHRTGRLLRLPGEVILLPRSAALAMRELAELPQPFTASAARQARGPTDAEHCVARPHRCRTLRGAAKIANPPRDRAFEEGAAAQVSVSGEGRARNPSDRSRTGQRARTPRPESEGPGGGLRSSLSP